MRRHCPVCGKFMAIYDAFDDVVRFHCGSCDIAKTQLRDHVQWGAETQDGLAGESSDRTRAEYEAQFAEFSRDKYGIDPESESETVSDQ